MRTISTTIETSIAEQYTESQVSKACKQVLRVIWSKGLDRGDLLPTQRELQQMYGFSHNVLSPAMLRLVKAGVVTRKPKVGTVVADRDAFREPIWRVALAENFTDPQSSAPFFSLLAGYVQRELIQLGCRTKLYLRTTWQPVPMDPLDSYGSLSSDACAGIIDGAIALGSVSPGDWRKAVGKSAPLCGFAESAVCGASIDQRTMTREAVSLLAAKKCQKITVVSNSIQTGFNRFWNGYEQGIAQARLTRWAGESLTTDVITPENLRGAAHQIAAGQRAAQELLSRPVRQRPDGLIVLDDTTAAGLCMALRDAGDYRPRIAVLTHLQFQQVYALPVYRFQLDIDLLARRGVAILHKRLLNPSLPNEVDWVVPQYSGEVESQFPLPLMTTSITTQSAVMENAS